MKKIIIVLLMSFVANTYATNGDNLIGVGPTSRALGGSGIAKAQDAISAIFSNPSTLTQIDGYEFNFSGTYFVPTVKAEVISPNPPAGVGNWKGTSKDEPFVVPAIGLSYKIDDKWFFGIGAYGVSGMGVDYRNVDPMKTNTKVSVMKFVPAVAYKNGNFSYGIGLDIDYQAADFGAGLSHNYALGARLGANYGYGRWNFGVVYVTPQNVEHKRIYDLDGLGGPTQTFNGYDNLKLENPAQYGFGISHKCSDRLLSVLEVKYLDWENADGYKDFGWKSQFVYSIGLNYKTNDKFTFRAGYNYGKNPVKKHNNFNPMGTTNVQGKDMSTFGYEYFRIVGFPAIVKNHITIGGSYIISQKFTLNLSYKHAFKETIKEISGPITLKSELHEDAFDFGITFKF